MAACCTHAPLPPPAVRRSRRVDVSKSCAPLDHDPLEGCGSGAEPATTPRLAVEQASILVHPAGLSWAWYVAPWSHSVEPMQSSALVQHSSSVAQPRRRGTHPWRRLAVIRARASVFRPVLTRLPQLERA